MISEERMQGEEEFKEPRKKATKRKMEVDNVRYKY